MAKEIDAQDCFLPAFIHSRPFVPGGLPDNLQYPGLFCGRFFVALMERSGRHVVVAVEACKLGISSMGGNTSSDKLSTLFSGACHAINVGDMGEKGQCSMTSSGVDAFAVISKFRVAMYSISNDGELTEETSASFADEIATADFISHGVIAVVSVSGVCYRVSREFGVTKDPIDSGFIGMSLHVAGLSGARMLVSSDKKVKVVDFSDGGSVNECECVDFPSEICTLQGMVKLGDDGEVALLGVSERGESVFVLICALNGNNLTCLQYSENEIFLSDEWTDKSYGILKYVPEIPALLSGHSLSESVAVFVKKQNSDWNCLLLPEGKQINCCLIDGDSSTSFLSSLSYCVLADPLDIPKSNEIAQCKLLVATVQRMGWTCLHFAECPSDWSVTMTPAPSPPSPYPNPLTSLHAQPESIETEPLPLNPELKAEPVKASTPMKAAEPPLFNPTIKPVIQPASAPPLFNPTLKAEPLKASTPVKAAEPPLFNPTVKPVIQSASAPPLFNPTLKAEAVKAAEPPLFNPTVKSVIQSAAVPPLFNPTLKATPVKAAEPPLFNPAIKPVIQSAAEPPLFNPKLKAEAVKASTLVKDAEPLTAKAEAFTPSFFGSSVAEQSKAASVGGTSEEKTSGGSLFGPFGQQSAFGSFGSTALPSASEKKESLFGSFGSTALPSASEKKESVFGSSALASGTNEKGTEMNKAPSVDAKKSDIDEKPKSSWSGPKLDESLIESFEKQLKEWEKIVSSKTRQTVASPFDIEGVISTSCVSPGSLESHRNTLIKLRDELNNLDSEINDAYSQDSSEINSDKLEILHDKCACIRQQLDAASIKSKRILSLRPSTQPLWSPNTPSASPLPTLFHPLPPTLRREPAAGLGLMSPVPVNTPPRRLRGGHRFDSARKDTYASRLSVTALREPVGSKRLSLGEVLTGKILGSPPQRRAPTIAVNSGHGASWQLLRQIEQQRKDLEKLLKMIENTTYIN